MRKIITIIFVLALSTYAFGQETGKPVKVGVIDMQRALNESEAGKQAKAGLEKLIKERQKVIDERIVQRDKLVAELEKQAVVLSEDARRQKQDALDKLTRDIERMISDSNAELQKNQRQLELEIFKDLDQIITEIGKNGEYTLILPTESRLYSADSVDLTDRVIEMQNELFKARSGKDEQKSQKK